MKPYSVLLFGSSPSKENDDCWTGEDFATLVEARECFANPWNTFDKVFHCRSTAVIVIDGQDVYEERANPEYRPLRDDREWQREIAVQAGMEGGCEAYNDACGY